MSEIRANTISDAAGTGPATLTKQSAAKAWVTWSASTATINDSVNLSSLTDNAVGDFTTSYTNNFNAAKGYTHGGISAHVNTDTATLRNVSARNYYDLLVGSTRFYLRWASAGSSGIFDYEYAESTCHGDLA